MLYEEFCALAGALWILAGVSAMAKLTRKCSAWLLTAGFVLAAVGFFTRWGNYIAAMDVAWLQAFPVVTLYESLTFVVVAFLAIFFIYRNRVQSQILNVTVFLIAGTAMLALHVLPLSPAPSLFLPSLKSYWLIMHVTLSFIAYAMFALAAVFATAYLWNNENRHIVAVASLLRQGTLIFTIGGIVFGAVWAQNSWGRFWAWDPKETWAFITWGVYLFLLHGTAKRWLSPKRLAWGAIAGLTVVGFTFIGVNIFFSGLHTYATV